MIVHDDLLHYKGPIGYDDLNVYLDGRTWFLPGQLTELARYLKWTGNALWFVEVLWGVLENTPYQELFSEAYDAAPSPPDEEIDEDDEVEEDDSGAALVE